MIEKRERWMLLIGILVIAALLFAMIAQAVRINEDDRIYRVSVIIDDAGDEYYKIFRKGMDSAALDYNVDVHFVLYDKTIGASQTEYLERELNNVPDAVVIRAANAAEISEWLENNAVSCPIISIGSSLDSRRQTARVSCDDYEAGRLLGEKIAADGALFGCIVYAGSDMQPDVYERFLGLNEVLQANGIKVDLRQEYPEGELTGSAPSVLAALDAQGLEKLASCAPGRVIYGIDYTYNSLYELENGVIKGIIVKSDFDLGYQSIKDAVDAVADSRAEDVVLPCYYVTAENMFDEQMTKLLFPIT